MDVRKFKSLPRKAQDEVEDIYYDGYWNIVLRNHDRVISEEQYTQAKWELLQMIERNDFTLTWRDIMEKYKVVEMIAIRYPDYYYRERTFNNYEAAKKYYESISTTLHNDMRQGKIQDCEVSIKVSE